MLHLTGAKKLAQFNTQNISSFMPKCSTLKFSWNMGTVILEVVNSGWEKNVYFVRCTEEV